VRVVSIDSGTRSAAAEAFLQENNVEHLILGDPDDVVTTAYRVSAIPVTVLVDHEGRVIFRHLGFAEEMSERFEKEIEMLIAWRDAA
jgi:hypothetical protein